MLLVIAGVEAPADLLNSYLRAGLWIKEPCINVAVLGILLEVTLSI